VTSRLARRRSAARMSKLQLLAADMLSREEALVAQELRAEEELGSIPEQEQNLHDWSRQLGDREAQLWDRELQLQEDQAALRSWVTDVADREMDLTLMSRTSSARKTASARRRPTRRPPTNGWSRPRRR
jgi:hypothetical protein